MSRFLDAIFTVAGWALLVGASGAFFAFGFASVCRWLKWAPINITVNVNQDPSPTSTEDKG